MVDTVFLADTIGIRVCGDEEVISEVVVVDGDGAGGDTDAVDCKVLDDASAVEPFPSTTMAMASAYAVATIGTVGGTALINDTGLLVIDTGDVGD